jgi:hypothetical protein
LIYGIPGNEYLAGDLKITNYPFLIIKFYFALNFQETLPMVFGFLFFLFLTFISLRLYRLFRILVTLHHHRTNDSYPLLDVLLKPIGIIGNGTMEDIYL